METKALYFVLFFLLVTSCKINQFKNNLRHGRWVYKDSTSNDVMLSKGRYRNGDEIGKWKHYTNGILFRQEKFKENRARVVNYYPNKKIESEGMTGLDRSTEMIHWYYDGKWNFYTEEGKLDSVKIYEKGTLVSSEGAEY